MFAGKKLKNKQIMQNSMWKKYSYFLKIYIIRGIGFRHYSTANDLNAKAGLLNINGVMSLGRFDCYSSLNYLKNTTFKAAQFLNVRAGHTADLLQPLPTHTYIKILKKERKLVIFGPQKPQVHRFAQKIFEYRSPSVYTGRGIRQKQIKYISKIGKKDKQKGKSF